MKAVEVHKMTDQELTTESESLRRKLYELRSQAVTEKLENPRMVGEIRRDVARILTEQKTRQTKTKSKAKA